LAEIFISIWDFIIFDRSIHTFMKFEYAHIQLYVYISMYMFTCLKMDRKSLQRDKT